MTFNFNTPMTFYEFLALCLSVLALILPLINYLQNMDSTTKIEIFTSRSHIFVF